MVKLKTLTQAIIIYFIDYFYWLKNTKEKKQKVSMLHSIVLGGSINKAE